MRASKFSSNLPSLSLSLRFRDCDSGEVSTGADGVFAKSLLSTLSCEFAPYPLLRCAGSWGGGTPLYPPVGVTGRWDAMTSSGRGAYGNPFGILGTVEWESGAAGSKQKADVAENLGNDVWHGRPQRKRRERPVAAAQARRRSPSERTARLSQVRRVDHSACYPRAGHKGSLEAETNAEREAAARNETFCCRQAGKRELYDVMLWSLVNGSTPQIVVSSTIHRTPRVAP